MPSISVTTPVFVLCSSRSGSTLLRYILDSHPDLCCPPELHLAVLAQQLYWVHGHTALLSNNATDEQRARAAKTRVRHTIDGIMQEYSRQLGKKVWCEKSIYTIDRMDAIYTTYPDARYVCLYRSCLDQVHSALDTLKYDPTGNQYGLTPFLECAPDNKVNGLIDYWCEKTSSILKFEQEHAGSCIRLKYESIVLDSSTELNRLFQFLECTWNEQLIDSIFTSHHTVGPGDHKISQTNSIRSDSIGRGDNIDVKGISDERLEKINQLHEVLGYRPVTR